jgi:hypothetical protein
MESEFCRNHSGVIEFGIEASFEALPWHLTERTEDKHVKYKSEVF